MDTTSGLRDYGLAFLLYEHGLGFCRYEFVRELFIFIKLFLNGYLENAFKSCLNFALKSRPSYVGRVSFICGTHVLQLWDVRPSIEGRDFSLGL